MPARNESQRDESVAEVATHGSRQIPQLGAAFGEQHGEIIARPLSATDLEAPATSARVRGTRAT